MFSEKAIIFVVLVLIILISSSSVSAEKNKCSVVHGNRRMNIGVVLDGDSRIGKEQEIAMKIAVHDLHKHASITFHLRFNHYSQTSTNATPIAMNLIEDTKVDAMIVGTLPFPDVAMLSKIYQNSLNNNIPIIFLTPTAIPPLFPSAKLPNSIQFAHDFSINAQCISALVGYFQWRKVTVIYEQSHTTFSLESFLASLYDSLKVVGASIARHVAFPPIISLSNPEFAIEEELYKLKNGSNRVFLVLNSSLQLVTHLFRKAKRMGMLKKQFTWIISDDIASMLDSVDPLVISSILGVIGFKTNYVDKSKPFKDFKSKFETSYFSRYPDEPNSNPSIYALRAYDAIQAIGKAAKFRPMLSNLLLTNFEGLSGNVRFKNGELQRYPVFEILKVARKSYEVVAFWTHEFGFTNEPPRQDRRMDGVGKEYVELERLNVKNLQPIVIGVPASGAFRQFVNVTTEVGHGNRTIITGFAIDVFNASLKNLPYDLPFELVPFFGTYDELVHKVHLKVYDAAIGDICIMGERYKWADFSQPYIKSGLSMVVTKKEKNTQEMWMFLMVFETKMWLLIPFMGLFIGFVVWSIEHGENSEFRHGSISQQIGTVIWFSFSVLFFVQRESPRRNLSRMVLAPWFFLVLMLTIYFTASLTSQMTISRLSPSFKDVETLRKENAGEIKAAFFGTSHAKVFLAKYCKGYTLAGPTFDFAGLGFAFTKGSSLTAEMSKAMLEAMESGEIARLESDMLSHHKCSTSTINSPMTSIGPKPFAGLFYISGTIASMAFLVNVVTSIWKKCHVLSFMKGALVNVKSWLRPFLTR